MALVGLPRSYPYPLGLLPNSDSYANYTTRIASSQSWSAQRGPSDASGRRAAHGLCRNVLDLDSNDAKSGSAPEQRNGPIL